MDFVPYLELIIGLFKGYFYVVFEEYRLGALLLFLIAIFFGSMFFAVFLSISAAKGYIVRGTLPGYIIDEFQYNDDETKKRSYRLVLEYCSTEGNIKRSAVSEFHNRYKAYRTGQHLNIKVIPHHEYDDVYIENEKGGLKIGIILIVAGLSGFSILTASISTFFVLLIITMLSTFGMYQFLSKVKPSKFRKGSLYDIENREIRPMEGLF